MLTKEQSELWDAAYGAARNNDVFDEKTTTLLHLTAALTAGCYP